MEPEQAKRVEASSDMQRAVKDVHTQQAELNTFMLAVLGLFEEYDEHDSLFWRTDGEYAPVTFYVDCSDVFFWGSSDGENLTPENLPALAEAIKDCQALVPEEDRVGHAMAAHYAFNLFVARVRGQRPQGACYPSDKRLWPLFDAAGPHRETGFGNPYSPGAYKAENMVPVAVQGGVE